MRKRGGIALILLGLILAALSGLIVLEFTRQAAEAATTKKAAAEVPVKRVYVVMADRDVPDNVPLTAQDVTTKEFPEAFVPAGAVAAPEFAVGKFTTSPLYKGQILVAPLLSQTRRSSQIAARVPEGKVALAVTVDDAMTSLGALRSGDRVDILLTVDLSKGLSKSGTTPAPAPGGAPRDQPTTLLSTQVTVQNVEILAIGAPGTETPSTPAKPQQGGQQAQPAAPPSKTITFLLDHQDAITLKFVKDSGGTMDLAVRSTEDKKLAKTEGVTFDSLYNQFRFRFPEPVR